jgi:hypothetical protein
MQGITNFNLNEKFAWVDQRLAEQYNRYAMTCDNIDDMMEAGLLEERYAWVDDLLQRLFYAYAVTNENADEYANTFAEEEELDGQLLARKHSRPTPMEIVIETLSGHKRNRSDSDAEMPALKKLRTEPQGNVIFIPTVNHYPYVNIVSDSESEMDVSDDEDFEENDAMEVVSNLTYDSDCSDDMSWS